MAHGYYKNCGGKVGHRRTEKCTGMYEKGIPEHGDRGGGEDSTRNGRAEKAMDGGMGKEWRRGCIRQRTRKSTGYMRGEWLEVGMEAEFRVHISKKRQTDRESRKQTRRKMGPTSV